MLLHTFTNILAKKFFGNDLAGRYYVSLTTRAISYYMLKLRWSTCPTSFIWPSVTMSQKLTTKNHKGEKNTTEKKELEQTTNMPICTSLEQS